MTDSLDPALVEAHRALCAAARTADAALASLYQARRDDAEASRAAARYGEALADVHLALAEVQAVLTRDWRIDADPLAAVRLVS